MNNEDQPKPKNDMMEIVHKSLNDTYDLAISHCIKTITDIWDAEKIYYPMRQEVIIKALSNLKNNK